MKVFTKFKVAVVFVLATALFALSAFAFIPVRLNFLVWGTVDLQRPTWIDFQSSNAPTRLEPDDLVRGQQGGEATILCADLSQRSVSSGVTYRLSNLCPQRRTPFVIEDDREGNYLPTSRREVDDLSVPFVISPRGAQILSDNLSIKWNAVPNAIYYVVRVRDPGGRVWEDVTSETELRYPSMSLREGESSFASGLRYHITVRTNTGGILTDETRPGLATFSFIDETAAREITSEVESVAELGLSDEVEAFISAQIYNRNGLFSEAISKLESVNPESSRSPAGYRFLGDLYSTLNLHRQARDAYSVALYIARGSENIEERATILAGLGGTYLILGDIQEGIDSLEKARELYIALEGDDSAIAEGINPQRITDSVYSIINSVFEF